MFQTKGVSFSVADMLGFTCYQEDDYRLDHIFILYGLMATGVNTNELR